MTKKFLQKGSSYNADHSPKDARLIILTVVIFLFGGVAIFRLFSLQILSHDFYLALAAGQHEISRSIIPERGKILIQEVGDSSETKKLYPLATNQSLYQVYAEPNRVENPAELAEKLTDIFFTRSDVEIKEGETPEILEAKYKEARQKVLDEILGKLSKSNDPYEPLKKRVSEEMSTKIRELKASGIGFTEESERFYPERNIGSHILGFLGTKDDKKIGQYGLEGFFEKDLAGRWIPISGRTWDKAEDGTDLVLTIDRNIQFFACNKLQEAIKKHRADSGSVIIMDPKTGAIWAMCSVPDFDPNDYAKTENINTFNNPAIFYQYEPGSIFKAITIASALDLGKITPATTYNDEGFLKIDGYTIRNSDLKAHGIQTMTQVLDASLNTGVVFAMNKMGVDSFRKYVNDFGFGVMTGIELDYEASGNVKSLEKKGEIWGATASFGQGISVTPIQMVSAFGALANGGKLMKPYIVDEARKSNGEVVKTSPKLVRQVISGRTSTLLGGMLVSVVENGHGKKAGVPGYYVAGKTGTAQVPKKDGLGYEADINICSFVGFAPVEDPKFVMLTKIDHPRDVIWAESSAAPLFGEIAQYVLNYLRVPPNRK